MSTSNKRKKQFAIDQDLKRLRSVNLAEEKINQASESFWPPLLSTYADSVLELDTGSRSDDLVVSSEEEEEWLEWDHEVKLK